MNPAEANIRSPCVQARRVKSLRIERNGLVPSVAGLLAFRGDDTDDGDLSWMREALSHEKYYGTCMAISYVAAASGFLRSAKCLPMGWSELRDRAHNCGVLDLSLHWGCG
jgi:hypothetical protein